jgi:hypothetical protein
METALQTMYVGTKLYILSFKPMVLNSRGFSEYRYPVSHTLYSTNEESTNHFKIISYDAWGEGGIINVQVIWTLTWKLPTYRWIYCFHLQCRRGGPTRKQTHKQKAASGNTLVVIVTALINLQLSLFFLSLFFFSPESRQAPTRLQGVTLQKIVILCCIRAIIFVLWHKFLIRNSIKSLRGALIFISSILGILYEARKRLI